MNVLVVGSGGREHVLAYKIAQSDQLDTLYLMPGSPGTSKLGKNVNIKFSNMEAVIEFCKNKSIELVVVGPEQPLVDGLADILREHNINVFGPSKEAAMIEGDKVFAKEIMEKANVPTAACKVYNKSEKSDALTYLKEISYPTVIKAYGLAAGKGVLICNNKEEAIEAVGDCFIRSVFGDAGDKIVIEEFLVGDEASIFAITDGEQYVTLPVSQDHKRVFNNDEGKNTGGMGAYAPAPVVDLQMLKRIEETIIIPTLKTLKNEKKKFNGCLYAGLMITKEGPKVIEFNCRFGDPEAQVVLPLLDGDFLELLYSAATGKLNKSAVKYNKGTAVCVIAASGGYPEKYEKGYEISGLDSAEDKGAIVFHAGTKEVEGKILTSGGRVLGVTALIPENDLQKCKDTAYRYLNDINFEGMHYRTDIANKALK